MEIPLRVDFGGGWLDHPDYAIEGAYIVNCAIEPLVSKETWDYEIGAGLGGSAARALLYGKDPVENELKIGAGWQDAAIIQETGLCAWKSGSVPVLANKLDGKLLENRMMLLWTGKAHNTPSLASRERRYSIIEQAGRMARTAIVRANMHKLLVAVDLSYTAQLDEGMAQLPYIEGSLAKKYCGGGHGGYALYLFQGRKPRTRAFQKLRDQYELKLIEPYSKTV